MQNSQLIAELSQGSPTNNIVLVSEECIYTIIAVDNVEGTSLIQIEPICDVEDYNRRGDKTTFIGGGGGSSSSPDALDVFGDLESVSFK